MGVRRRWSLLQAPDPRVPVLSRQRNITAERGSLMRCQKSWWRGILQKGEGNNHRDNEHLASGAAVACGNVSLPSAHTTSSIVTNPLSITVWVNWLSCALLSMHSTDNALHNFCFVSDSFTPKFWWNQATFLFSLFSCSCIQGNSADFSETLAQPKNFTCRDSLWVLAYDSKPGCLQNWGELFKTIESFGLSLLREIAGNKALYSLSERPSKAGSYCRALPARSSCQVTACPLQIFPPN